ncbi:MAG: FAD-dependent oxidoreductase [Deltaproteobacteria bacterium]|nr:FAD-dependent oxidoreductase [Deltaproteobacteria bacterium]
MAERVVVVGGGAGGPSAAAKAKRLKPDLDIHIIEAGPHVSYAACPTPYYIADMIATPEEIIARTPEEFEKSGIHVHLNTAVEELDFNQGTALDSRGKRWSFDKLVYAAGASSILPDIPGAHSGRIFALKSLQDAIRIKTFIETRKPKSVIILGAGFIALEMCEAFRLRGLDTTVLYRGNLPAKRMGEELSKIVLDEMKANGVRFVPGVEPAAIVEEADRLRVETKDGVFSADMVLAALGVHPGVAATGVCSSWRRGEQTGPGGRSKYRRRSIRISRRGRILVLQVLRAGSGLYGSERG